MPSAPRGSEQASAAVPTRLVESPGFLLSRVGAASRQQMIDAFAQRGFVPRDWGVLEVLNRDVSASQEQVRGALGIDRSDMSHIAVRLVSEGLVTISPSSSDARVKLLSLTPRGATELEAMRALADHVSAELLAPLSSEGRHLLMEVLQQLAEHHAGIARPAG